MTARARRLRRESTVPEGLLWSRLRSGRLGGLKWRRQHIIGRYVVDFFCPPARLVVELDGVTHIGRENEDAARTRHLEQRGYRVLRFTDDEVLRNLDAVAITIAVAAGLEM